jgi:hypothetical protein
MMRRLAGSLVCGLATLALFIGFAFVLPPQTLPAIWPGGLRNTPVYIGLALQTVIRWQFYLFDRLMPRAPGDMINFKSIVVGMLADVLLLTVIFYSIFTLVARHRKRRA